MSSTPAKPAMLFQFPIASDQRRHIENFSCEAGPTAQAPNDALIFRGRWRGATALQLRPIFPGSMRFIATNRPKAARVIAAIKRTHGVSARTLKSSAQTTGVIQIGARTQQEHQQLQSQALIPAVGTWPTEAFYGPVSLSPEFLSDALLDHEKGLGALTVIDASGKQVRPGKPGWREAALAGFLAGTYQPLLRIPADANAASLPMPSLVMDTDQSFELAITLGWSKSVAAKLDGPTSAQLETIPADAFLRHIARQLREPVLSSQGADAVMRGVFNNEDTSDPWTQRLRNALIAVGFGAIDGSTPLEMTLREFQLCAASKWSAEAKNERISSAQLALRDFRDLRQVANPEVYEGAISGRANVKTRSLIARWTREGLRNPLVLPAFHQKDLANGRPSGEPTPLLPDIWNTHQQPDADVRVFCANLMREDLRGEIGYDQLEWVAKFIPKKIVDSKVAFPGGPGPWLPSDGIPMPLNPGAEITPESLGLSASADLIAASTNPQRANRRLVAEASCFRVVRAVSEVESLGYLDLLNAYDFAGISLAPFHWAMAFTRTNPSGSCELGALAAELAAIERKEPGIDLFRTFGNSVVGATALSSTRTRQAILGFIDDRGRPRHMSSEGPKDFMPSWRSVYRWVRAGRNDPKYGQGAWRMALKRISDICATPFKIAQMPDDPRNPSKQRTIGSVFTSELLVAELVRWHVKAPHGVVVNGAASPWLDIAYGSAAKTNPGTDPKVWEERLQAALMQEIRDFAAGFPEHKELPKNFETLAAPNWINLATKEIDETKNPYRYRLDPRLRLLEGTFQRIEPR